MTFKQRLCAAFSLLSLLSLSSCIDLTLDTTLNADDTGEMVLEMRSPASMVSFGDDDKPTQADCDKEREEGIAEETSKAKKAGLELIDYSITLEGDNKVERTKLSFTDIDQLNAYLNDGEKSQMKIAVTKFGPTSRLSQTFTPSEKAQSSSNGMMEAALADSNLTLKWNLPGDISSANEGAEISADKRTVTWKINLLKMMKEGFAFEATYTKDGPKNIIGLIIIGIIVLAGGIFLFNSMKK